MSRGSGRQRSLALTFDDGPTPGSLHLLDVLAAHGIRATFFQCGANVEQHGSIARRIAAAGHELGNHTYSHPRLCPGLTLPMGWRSPRSVAFEFERAQQVILYETGISPRLMRCPYGLRWWGMRDVQRRLGLLDVTWTVIGHDWEWQTPAVVRLILRRASPGGIVCLHDGREVQANPDVASTISAVRSIIPTLKDRGYTFQTVSDLLGSPLPTH